MVHIGVGSGSAASLLANAALLSKINLDVEDVEDRQTTNRAQEVQCEANFDSSQKTQNGTTTQWLQVPQYSPTEFLRTGHNTQARMNETANFLSSKFSTSASYIGGSKTTKSQEKMAQTMQR